MGKEDTNTSYIVRHYLRSLYEDKIISDESQENRTIVVWDNAPVHSSNITTEFAKSANLRVLTIPPYTPCLNPAEKLINSIKMKLKKLQADGK